jgi:protein-S-isoprenylcysteine O-methyltransferase Ste14
MARFLGGLGVRHPIYSGLLLAFLGTALATSLYGLMIAAVLGGSFIYAATVEERNLASTFPSTYPQYRAATRMLIPFLL